MDRTYRTVAAQASARGASGIAAIRISGSEAFAIAGGVFRPKKKGLDFFGMRHGECVYGEILRGGEVFDEGMAVKFFAPGSFTGEDTVEIFCHGSVYIADMTLAALIERGAYPAGPGEFTKRAYLNGKLTLTGAEAVGRLIAAENSLAAKLALAQSRGGLSRKISVINEKILLLLAKIYVFIDYPGEDLEDVSPAVMSAALREIEDGLLALYRSYDCGRVLAGGIETAIIGKPNAGKSTVLNLLSGEETAIVHHSPGTTRDIVSARVKLGGFVLNLADTAGMRETADAVESIGMERARKRAGEADLLFAVFDASSEPSDGDFKVAELMRGAKKALIIMNKTDLGDLSRLYAEFLPRGGGTAAVEISAKTKPEEAREKLVAAVGSLFSFGEAELAAGEIISEERQYIEIAAALEAVRRAARAVAQGFPQDVAALDLEEAAAALSRSDAKGLAEDIVDTVFRNFCVGK